MARRTSQPPEVPPDLPPEKAYAALSTQLTGLRALRGRTYQDAKATEDEWDQLTEKLIIRAFGSNSPNVRNFHSARWAGKHRAAPYGGHTPHNLYQANFEARLDAYESVLKSCLAELKLDLPEAEIKGVYGAGEEYEFYRDVKTILGLAQREIFVIDPYLSAEIFDVYATAIPRTVLFRLLSSNVPADVKALAEKYASGGNFHFRHSGSIHDRAIFADSRVWLCGQSLKDAAKKKPTYIVEHDEALMRPVYETIWQLASPIV